jgi:hypothetical protein
MKRRPAIRFLVLAGAVLAAAACQKAPETASAPPPSSTSSAPASSQAASSNASAPVPAPLPKVEVCKLLSAAEVSALMGKTLIQNGCDYGLDPSAKEKALADNQARMDQATKHAAAGDMNGFMKGMMQAGQGQQKTAGLMGEQMTITVDASRDDQTEDQIKAIYAKTGATVRTATAPLAPAQRGVNNVIEGLDEVGGVGDWAFATNVASISMGMGMSFRGRILEARKGPWHVTVSGTVGPDPGAKALDDKLAGVARALIAKL